MLQSAGNSKFSRRLTQLFFGFERPNEVPSSILFARSSWDLHWISNDFGLMFMCQSVLCVKKLLRHRGIVKFF